MKKFFTATVLSALLLTGTAFAAEGEIKEGFEQLSAGFCHEALLTDEASLMSESDSENGFEKMLKGIEKADSEIEFDEDDFIFTLDPEINYDEKGEFIAVQFSIAYKGFIDRHPELFYLGNSYNYSYKTNEEEGTYTVVSLIPSYTMGKPEINKAKKEFDSLTDEIAEYVTENSDSKLEKAILLHDYIVLNYEYDNRVYSDDENVRNAAIHDTYRFITEGKGVCESYAKLYRYVLELCGMEVKYSSSAAMNHVWNIVNIDGKWYHVDVTWDDPTPNMHGYLSYSFFLIGDDDISNTAIYDKNIHHDFTNEDGIVCEKTYEDAFWGHMTGINEEGFYFTGDAPIVFDENNFYFTTYNNSTKTSAITSRSKEDGSEKNVVTFTERWRPYSNPKRYYPSNFSGLSLIDGVLIYNTPTQVRYILPDGSHDTLIKTLPENAKGHIYLFGTSIDGKFYEHEPFYTHINPDNIKKPGNDKYSKHYKDGKDMYHVEIDCFVATDPYATYGNCEEWDVDVHIAFEDIHTIVEETTRKPTFVTKGKKHKHCTGCENVNETILTDPYCKEGAEAHEPTTEDIIDIIKCVLGMSEHTDDEETSHSQNDIDNDGKLSLHDINEIFKIIREENANKQE